MAGYNARVNLDVCFITFHDDDLPGTSVTDFKNPSSFVLTTGGFPHEVIVQTRASSAKMARITVTANDAKDVLLEKSCGEAPNNFEVMAERTLTRSTGGATQSETFDLDPEGAGRDIRHLRLTILSGYSDFVAVYGMEAWGEESQQRIAVLQSKPEVVL